MPFVCLKGTWLFGGLFLVFWFCFVFFCFAGMKFVQSLKRVNLTASISVRACELESSLGIVFA